MIGLVCGHAHGDVVYVYVFIVCVCCYGLGILTGWGSR